jgi:hypothetical protein
MMNMVTLLQAPKAPLSLFASCCRSDRDASSCEVRAAERNVFVDVDPARVGDEFRDPAGAVRRGGSEGLANVAV